MAVKVYLSSGIVVVNDNNTINNINQDSFFFEEDINQQFVILRDSNDGYSKNVLYSDITDEFGSVIGAYSDVIDYLKEIKSTSAIVSAVSPYQRVPYGQRETGPGVLSVLGGKIYSFSVSNVGAADGLVIGMTIKPGETLSWSAGALNNYYIDSSITFDGTGTELVIIYNS